MGSPRLARFAAALVTASLGCTNDFDVFTPTDDGDADTLADSGAADGARPRDSAAADAAGANDAAASDGAAEGGPCTTSPSCITSAAACTDACHQAAGRCHGAFCNVQEQQCLNQCERTCVNCTNSAGCPSASACATATK